MQTTSQGDPSAGRYTYAGIFLISSALLMFQILLTRIFSVSLYYHLAFLTISMAMYGLTLGAVQVHSKPQIFVLEKTQSHLVTFSLLFSVTTVISLAIHLYVPLSGTLLSRFIILLTLPAIACPFIFSGVCICLLLTRFPAQVGKLYAFDLSGAAAGCLLLIGLLEVLDAPSAVLAIALIASCSSVLFSMETSSRKLILVSITTCVLLAVLLSVQLIYAQNGKAPLRVMWVKGEAEKNLRYEKWNTFSRISVYGDPEVPHEPFGWGLSRAYQPRPNIKELNLEIDANALTVLTNFNGDLDALEHLRYDVTNIAHYLRKEASVLIVGTGGGRDVLSALTFGQKQILGIEYNKAILGVALKEFGDFTGHLDAYPQVRFLNDEARSAITRSKENFDLIQISLIDTWAATAAGAFALTENSLYTVEAYREFIAHLKPNGILSVSRWYQPQSPGEMYRSVSLAAAGLKASGISTPREHLVLVISSSVSERIQSEMATSIGTLLISKAPFGAKDVQTLTKISQEMRFDLVLTPHSERDRIFESLAAGSDPSAISRETGLNLDAPTDNKPFFFHLLKLRNAFKSGPEKLGANARNAPAMQMLIVLFCCVFLLMLVTIFKPLLKTSQTIPTGRLISFPFYFGAIGLGYMLIEISMMQNLTIFLGHPIYGLTVLLFGLLLSSGLGSFASEKLFWNKRSKGLYILLLLILAGVVFGISVSPIMRNCRAYSNEMRIAIACGLILPLGLLMGMPFPTGMKIAARIVPAVSAWLWAINGATSVCASVLAVILCMSLGIQTCYWAGLSCYLVACISFTFMNRLKEPENAAMESPGKC